jgi:FixJ family two-component response regulator
MATDLLNAGIVDYLVKPVVQEKLLASVEAAMERRTELRHDH